MPRAVLKSTILHCEPSFAHTKAEHAGYYRLFAGYQYWVPIEGEWYPVPPEAVIKTDNPVGEAIVWYLPQNPPESDLPRSAWYKIVCFVPSNDV